MASELAKEHVLCSSCHDSVISSNLSPTLSKVPQLFRSYPNLAELRKSSLAGCHLCSLVLGTFGYGDLRKFRDNKVEVRLSVAGHAASLTVYSISQADPENRELFIDLILLNHIPPQPSEDLLLVDDSSFVFSDPSVYKNAQLSKSLSYEASAALAREWLRQCTEQHPKCAAASKLFPLDRGYPTRLVYAGSSENDLKLVVTAEIASCLPNAKLEYLTLSHCWGGADVLKLTTRNMNELKSAIPFTKLPQTFQDAVVITRQLGFQYLWIDSLCIIQDSELDWSSEAMIMGEIYANSTCTIAALTARSSSEGCFVGHGDEPSEKGSNERNPLAFRTCNLPDRWYAKCFQQLRPGILLHPAKRLALHERGWVVQERLFAPRTLYYGAWGLAWECVECSATESSPVGNSALYSAKTSFLAACTEAADNSLQATNMAYDAWCQLWLAYTPCQLTNFDDRIVAISSFIRQIEKITSWTNIWGLWKEKLPYELLWGVETPSKRPSTKEYLGPSWSWVRIQGGLSKGRLEGLGSALWAAEVVETGIDHGKGFLRLRTVVKEVVSPSDQMLDLVNKRSSKNWVETWQPDLWDPDIPAPPVTGELSCLLIMRITPDIHGDYVYGLPHDDHTYDFGLVVSHIGQETVRVGRFWQDASHFLSPCLFDEEIRDEDIREVVLF
ncbi:heterokaryon incompatibility protein-domain-containing protein [Annulohypoxylon nitens]|nr:heterokaryon incompatibility protein-domain-containing protein [Annulohypoxylon nitens]